MTKLSVLYVCTENICRSPLAEGIMLEMLKDHGLKKCIKVDSAGIHASQPGHKPDVRAVKVAGQMGIKLRGIRARRITPADFVKNDYILAMDAANHQALKEVCPPEFMDKIYLFMEFSPESEVVEVPDPYYGPVAGFDYVFELLQKASQGLLVELLKQINKD